jgi:cyclic di-GMP phosphodiesterase
MSRKILIVDDCEAIRRLLARLLADQYELAAAASGEEALLLAGSFEPDIVLLDIMMPGMDGYETCRQLKTQPPANKIPHIIMVSANSSREEQLFAFQAGADDYVVKPVDQHELRSRVELHFRLQDAQANVASLQSEIDAHVADLKQLAEHRTQEIVATQDVTVFTLAKVAESRDETTGRHLLRMRSYSQILAEHLSKEGPYRDQIDRDFLDDLYRSSPLHDIGKVAVSDAILLKPGLLTPEEFETIKMHTVAGANILDEAVYHSHSGGFLAMAAIIARFHHERFDGSGYPAGLEGQGIPLPARIVAVADVYDALTSSRPYKPAYRTDTAREIIEDESGKHFDPPIVRAFLECHDEFTRVKEANREDMPVVVGAMSFKEHDLPTLSESPKSEVV